MTAPTAIVVDGTEVRVYPRWLEVVKLVAFVAMLADHWELIVGGSSSGLGHMLGRFSFPAFCLAFGLGMAYTPSPLRVGVRLLVVGVVAAGAWLLVKPPEFANVLLLFAWFAFVVAANDHRPLQAVLLVGLVFFCAIGRVEGGLAGPALLMAGYWASRPRGDVVAVLVASAWASYSGELGALLAAVAFAAALVARQGEGPRWRAGPSLLWLYPAHIAAFAVVAMSP